jgi:hypothetical protein
MPFHGLHDFLNFKARFVKAEFFCSCA